jgi:hypothetical protein
LALADADSGELVPPRGGKFPTGAMASFRFDGAWKALRPHSAMLFSYTTPKAMKKEERKTAAKHPDKPVAAVKRKTGKAAAAKQPAKQATKAKKPATKTTAARDEGQRREGQAKARDRRQKGSAQAHNRRSQRCVAPFSSDIDRAASGGLASPHTCQAICPQHTTTSARDASCTRPRTGASSSGIIARGAIQDRHQTVADLKRAATPGSSSPDFTCRRVPIGGLRAISIASSGEPIGAARVSGHPIGPRIDNVMNDDAELIERLNSA